MQEKRMTDSVLEGTWEEVVTRTPELQGHRVRVIILSTEEEARRHFYHTASPEEWERAFDAIGKGNERLPIPPSDAFERESFYEDRF
jgi:hypothetical protein